MLFYPGLGNGIDPAQNTGGLKANLTANKYHKQQGFWNSITL